MNNLIKPIINFSSALPLLIDVKLDSKNSYAFYSYMNKFNINFLNSQFLAPLGFYPTERDYNNLFTYLNFNYKLGRIYEILSNDQNKFTFIYSFKTS